MRAFVFLSLLSVALAATKCDAKRAGDKSVSRGNGPRIAKSSTRGSSRKGKGSSGGASVADRTLLAELVQTNSQRNGLNASNPAQVASLTDKANFINVRSRSI